MNYNICTVEQFVVVKPDNQIRTDDEELILSIYVFGSFAGDKIWWNSDYFLNM